MSEKDYTMPSSDNRGTEFRTGDELRFGGANPALRPLAVVEAARSAHQAAMSAAERRDVIETPRDAIARRTALLCAVRQEESGGALDIEHDDQPTVAFIDAMHNEQTQQLSKDDVDLAA